MTNPGYRKRKFNRLPEYLFTVWVIVTMNFFLPRIMPGDPFLFIAGDEGEEIAQFSAEQKEYYLNYYGLDRPVFDQYLSYLSGLLRGDLGYSLYYHEHVSTILFRRLPWTLFLVTGAVILSTVAGCVLGSVSALYRDRWIDRLLFFFMILVSEIPAFLLGLILLFLFAAGTGWFPLSGAMTHFANYRGVADGAADVLNHAVLPVTALTFARLSGIYLLARSSMTTVLSKDYMRTARAKGLSGKRILFRHAMRNSMLPVVTRICLTLGTLVGGAVLVENVFSYPGLGLLIREAVMVHDYPLIQGIFLLVTVSVLTANFFSDRLYGKIDPRIEDLN